MAYSINNKLVKWLEHHVWPWNVIAKLRKERDGAIRSERICYETYVDGYNSHWVKWVANANRLWGPNPFDDGQIRTMRSFYDEGECYRTALDRLRIHMGIKSHDQNWLR